MFINLVLWKLVFVKGCVNAGLVYSKFVDITNCGGVFKHF